ncbi:hypothetical protein STEG23_016928 [Scotinomys teguina]
MAPKTLSPDQIMEEPVTVVSCKEVSSDVSVTEKYSKEEALAGSSHNLSMLHYDDTSESMAERNLPLPKSISGSRMRQQVQECPSVSSSPDRLPEDLSSHTNPGHVSQEDVSMLSSSGDLGEASLVSSPEKQPADTIGITGTDNPSIGKMLSEGEHSSVQCFSHTVNLIVSEAIKSQRMVQNVLSIARKLCEQVHRSPRTREKLAELQKDYELPQYQLNQDVPSKWSTSFHMFNS